MSHNIKVERITPELAKKYLEQNTRNRPVSPAQKAKLKQALRKGEYEFNGDPIRFHQDGHLMDGQHRLLAVKETGIAIDSVVITGLNGEADNTIDQGAKRTLAQMFARDGEKYSLELAGAIRYYYIFTHRRPLSVMNDSISIKDGYILLSKARGIRSTVATTKSWNINRLGHAALLTGAYHACRMRTDKEWADEFWEETLTGVELEAGTPQYLLRNKLLDNKLAPVDKKMNRSTVVALVLKAWNAYINGEVMENCRITKAELNASLSKGE